MRVLVTGGAGFLGSHLCDRFLLEGFEVVVLDNLVTGRRNNLLHLVGNHRFEVLEADVCEPLASLAGPWDVVCHLASPASPKDYQQHSVETLRAGAVGAFNTLDLAREHGARYLLTSTSEVYGDPLVHPQREEYWGNVNPVGPRSMYDEAKRFGEALAMAYHRAYGVDVRIARIFNTYGPRMRADDGRVVSNFIFQALEGQPLTVYGDGRQTRSLCYVSDTVEGLYRLATVKDPQERVVNIGNPHEMTMLELAALVRRLVGSEAPVVHQPLPQDDPTRRKPDISRAMRVLGWQPQVSVEDGLRRTIVYFQQELAQRAQKVPG